MLGEEYKYPEWSYMVGWAVTSSSVLCIPMYIIYKFCCATKGDCRERLRQSFKPEMDTSSIIPRHEATSV